MARFLKKHGSTMFLLIVMAIGIGLLAYPAASDWWNQVHQSRALSGYTSVISHISSEDYQELLDAAREYNARLASGVVNLESDENAYLEYESLLDPAGTGVMGYVEIKKINVKLPIYHGTDDNVLQVAVGHLFGSSLPVGGESTHVCVSGHTGLPKAMLFTDLTELVNGDTFTLSVLNELLTYQIDQIKVVEPSDTSDLKIVPGQDYVTLITCTPYGVNSHRLLVRGHRIENLPEDPGQTALDRGNIASQAARLFDVNMIGLCLIAVILIIMGLLFIFNSYKRRKGRRDE